MTWSFIFSWTRFNHSGHWILPVEWKMLSDCWVLSVLVLYQFTNEISVSDLSDMRLVNLKLNSVTYESWIMFWWKTGATVSMWMKILWSVIKTWTTYIYIIQLSVSRSVGITLKRLGGQVVHPEKWLELRFLRLTSTRFNHWTCNIYLQFDKEFHLELDVKLWIFRFKLAYITFNFRLNYFQVPMEPLLTSPWPFGTRSCLSISI
jgi:hypothetical protein